MCIRDRNKVAVVVIGVGRGRVLYELNVVEICFAAVFAVATGYLYLVGGECAVVGVADGEGLGHELPIPIVSVEFKTVNCP